MTLEERVDQLDADVLDLSKAFTDLLGMYLSLIDRVITLEHYVDTNNEMHWMVYETMPPLLEELHTLSTQTRADVNSIISELWPKVRGLELNANRKVRPISKYD